MLLKGLEFLIQNSHHSSQHSPHCHLLPTVLRIREGHIGSTIGCVLLQIRDLVEAMFPSCFQHASSAVKDDRMMPLIEISYMEIALLLPYTLNTMRATMFLIGSCIHFDWKQAKVIKVWQRLSFLALSSLLKILAWRACNNPFGNLANSLPRGQVHRSP